jgi:hypothetical protein
MAAVLQTAPFTPAISAAMCFVGAVTGLPGSISEVHRFHIRGSRDVPRRCATSVNVPGMLGSVCSHEPSTLGR